MPGCCSDLGHRFHARHPEHQRSELLERPAHELLRHARQEIHLANHLGLELVLVHQLRYPEMHNSFGVGVGTVYDALIYRIFIPDARYTSDDKVVACGLLGGNLGFSQFLVDLGDRERQISPAVIASLNIGITVPADWGPGEDPLDLIDAEVVGAQLFDYPVIDLRVGRRTRPHSFTVTSTVRDRFPDLTAKLGLAKLLLYGRRFVYAKLANDVSIAGIEIVFVLNVTYGMKDGRFTDVYIFQPVEQ